MGQAIQLQDNLGNSLPAIASLQSVFDENGGNIGSVIAGIKRHLVSSTDFDVVIVGSGSAGIAAAYALKDSALKVCVIEKFNVIGGTALNAWMNCFAASGDVPFLKTITEDLMADGKALYVDTRYQPFSASDLANVVYDDTIVEQRFIKNGRTEACVSYDPDALRARYANDLSRSMILLTSAELVDVEKDGTSVTSIVVNTPHGQMRVSSKVFIDATADDVLLRLAGDGYTLIGSDAKTRYQSEYGFTESNAGSTSVASSLNWPDLIYRVTLGTEDLSGITAAYGNNLLPYYNPDKKYIYLNPCASIAGNDAKGANIYNDGAAAVYARMQPRTIQQWKAIKNAGGFSQAALNNYDVSVRKFDSFAPMLGVRETYRAKCERMLNENHFYVQISSSNLADGDNIDKKIAYGNHIADSHGDNTIDTSAINASLVPYGVPYGCIVPKGLTNVLVASRGAGLTHVGACSFRLNKDVMQLGYAAGKAALIYNEDGLSDTRNVDVEKLQSAQYTNFVGLIDRLESYIL